MSLNGNEIPICVATVICDQVIEDARTHNKSAIGIFNGVSTQQLPAVHPRMFALVSLTNVRGTAAFQMVLRSPSNSPVVQLEGKIENAEPLVTYDIVVELLGIPLEEAGTYFFDVMQGGNVLGGRRFMVMVQPTPSS